jgi:Terminase small subunit
MPALRSRKLETFANEVADLTPPRKAALMAGYRDTPWTEANARKRMQKPEVRTRIIELEAERRARNVERADIHVAYLQRRLLEIFDASVTDLFQRTPEGKYKLKPLMELKRSIAESIQRVKIDPDSGEPTEVILPDRLAAGQLLLKSLGGLIDRKEVSGPNGGPVEIGPAQLEMLEDDELEMLQQLSLRLEHVSTDGDAKESSSAG